MLSYKKILLGLAPLVAVLAFAIAPAMAQAAPEWLFCMKVTKGEGLYNNHGCKEEGGTEEWEWLPVGPKAEKLAVVTKGTLTLTGSNGVVITCTVKDKGFVWNESGGKDEVTEFVNSPCESSVCTSPTLTAEKLPWASALVEVAGVVRDRVTGVQIKAVCSGSTLTFTGTLEPKINSANGTAEFGSGSGTLTAGSVTGTVSGNDAVEQTNGWAVTAP